MDVLVWLLAAFAGFHLVRGHYQKQHIALLAAHLAQFQVERHMQSLSEGYLRALREPDSARRQQIWALFAPAEKALASQFRQVADAFGRQPSARARISRLAVCVPYLEVFFPQATRDFRELLLIHADGLERVAANAAQRDAQERAYQLSAEQLLLRHSCHWFCKSRNVAHARLLAQHQVSYEKVLESVSPETRHAYRQWLHA